MTDDIPALRRKLAQLSAQHDSGALSAEAFAAEKARIERQLLDHVLADSAAPVPASRPSRRLVASLAAGVLAVAGAGYWWTGSPGKARVNADASGSPSMAQDEAQQSENERKFAEAVGQLAEKLKQHPENPEGWALLARSYVRLGQLEPALAAFKQSLALRNDDAGVLVDYADVLAVANGRSLQGEPSRLIQRALELDPEHPKALSLAGAAAFDRQDYADAVRYWEHVIRLAPPGSAYVPELQAGIDEARRLGALPPPKAAESSPAAVPQAATAPSSASSAAPNATSAAATASAIRGTVRLAPALAGKAAPTDTVFVYARAAEGQRMPLAILRLQVKDLPATFTLDDSLAMSPAARLSSTQRVIVSARVSKSGQAAPSAGDLVGETPAMANHGDGVALVIDKVIER